MIITEDPARAAQVSRTELGCIDLDYLCENPFFSAEKKGFSRSPKEKAVFFRNGEKCGGMLTGWRQM